jgi:NAD(P)H dehydrogenase (quinone)
MKIAIIYHSESGNTAKVADLIAAGAQIAPDFEIKTMSIDAVDPEFVAAAKAVIFGCPTYYGTFSWQMKKWFDTKGKLDLAGKLGSVFATANHFGGGSEVAELGMAAHLLVGGMLVYTPGTSQGAPFLHFGAVTIKDGDQFQKERAKIFGQRIAAKALELFGEQ